MHTPKLVALLMTLLAVTASTKSVKVSFGDDDDAAAPSTNGKIVPRADHLPALAARWALPEALPSPIYVPSRGRGGTKKAFGLRRGGGGGGRQMGRRPKKLPGAVLGRRPAMRGGGRGKKGKGGPRAKPKKGGPRGGPRGKPKKGGPRGGPRGGPNGGPRRGPKGMGAADTPPSPPPPPTPPAAAPPMDEAVPAEEGPAY